MPKVSPSKLLLLTGFIWFVASCILIGRSISWSQDLSLSQLYWGIGVGFILFLVKTHFIFRNLTNKNITRIRAIKSKQTSLWNFHNTRDKYIIVLMIVIGIGLRQVEIVPIYALLPVYLGIGMAMFYVCLMYLKDYLKGN